MGINPCDYTLSIVKIKYVEMLRERVCPRIDRIINRDCLNHREIIGLDSISEDRQSREGEGLEALDHQQIILTEHFGNPGDFMGSVGKEGCPGR